MVALLEHLGIKMVVEDRGTNDVHGEVMGGWPVVVNRAISETHSLDYSPQDLTSSSLQFIETAISKLTNQLGARARGGVKKFGPGNKDELRKSSIEYGFKAPVSITLVPMFHHSLGKGDFYSISLSQLFYSLILFFLLISRM